jgi:hypothetical protein
MLWRTCREFQRLTQRMEPVAKNAQAAANSTTIILKAVHDRAENNKQAVAALKLDIGYIMTEVLRSRDMAHNKEGGDQTDQFLQDIDNQVVTESQQVDLGREGVIDGSRAIGNCTIEWIPGRESEAKLTLNATSVLGSADMYSIDNAFDRINDGDWPDGKYRTREPAICNWDPEKRTGWVKKKGKLEKLG